MSRVSVIVPAHEAAGTIAATLDSVAEQRFGDWEVIVADDGSSDATAEIVEGHLVGARLVRSPAARGPAAARNAALRHAGGELVAFLDADDTWLPAYLGRQVARYEAEQAAGGPPVGMVAWDARVRLGAADQPFTYVEQARREQHVPVEPL